MAQGSYELKEHHEATPRGQTLHGAVFDPRDQVADEIRAFILACAREARIVSQAIAPIGRYVERMVGAHDAIGCVLVTIVTE